MLPLFKYLVALTLCSCVLTIAHADEPTSAIRVMSYNIRNGVAKDGENHWEKRKDFLVGTIQQYNPDLLGTQETYGFQRDYIAQHLKGYEAFGVGREDGAEQGEMTALFYRTSRFEKIDGGHFWLSETPEVVGSKSWDSALPRMVSYVKLRDRLANNRELTFFNTHFDHRGKQARVESARLLRQRMEDCGKNSLVILTGDFNAEETSGPYNAVFADNAPLTFLDTFRTHHPVKVGDEQTAGGFVAVKKGDARIDWIACSSDFKVLNAEIDRTSRNGVTPSDHYPVNATLAWPSATSISAVSSN